MQIPTVRTGTKKRGALRKANTTRGGGKRLNLTEMALSISKKGLVADEGANEKIVR